MKTILILICLWLAPALVRGQGTATYTVFPIGFENMNGNAGDLLFRLTPDERQQVVLGSYLQQVWTTPVLIREIAFRVNDGDPAYTAIIPSVELRLSTTQRTPATLGPEWRFNSGPDGRTVFLGNNLQMNSSGGPGPNPFDLRFSLAEPFYYDPSAGNLLMFVAVGGTGELQGASGIDLHAFENLNASPVAIIGGPAQSPVAYGFVNQIGWTVVPEPAVYALFVISIPWLVRSRQKRR